MENTKITLQQEVLEIGKRLGTDGANLLKARSIIKFDMSEISASLATYNKLVTDCKFIFFSHF